MSELKMLSESDVKRVSGVPDLRIIRYPDLKNVPTWAALVNNSGKAAAVLFLVDSETSGHWIAAFQGPDGPYVFDPLGTALDAERKMIPADKRAELGQSEPELARLLASAHKEGAGSPHVNHTEFQEFAPNVNTCGRWVGLRIAKRGLTDSEFKAYVRTAMDSAGCSDADEWITKQTAELAGGALLPGSSKTYDESFYVFYQPNTDVLEGGNCFQSDPAGIQFNLEECYRAFNPDAIKLLRGGAGMAGAVSNPADLSVTYSPLSKTKDALAASPRTPVPFATVWDNTADDNLKVGRVFVVKGIAGLEGCGFLKSSSKSMKVVPDSDCEELEGGDLPDSSVLQRLAKQSYEQQGDAVVDGAKGNWRLVHKTPTLSFYAPGDLSDKRIVVACRGTKDFRDLKADASIAFGRLEKSRRWKEDERVVREQKARFPSPEWTWYATGHSLGGAIADLLIKHGLVTEALSYNPAVSSLSQLGKSHQDHRHTRIYTKNDPLGALGRAFGLKGNVEVRDTGNQGALAAHALDNFQGGKGHTEAESWNFMLPILAKHRAAKQTRPEIPVEAGVIAGGALPGAPTQAEKLAETKRVLSASAAKIGGLKGGAVQERAAAAISDMHTRIDGLFGMSGGGIWGKDLKGAELPEDNMYMAPRVSNNGITYPYRRNLRPPPMEHPDIRGRWMPNGAYVPPVPGLGTRAVYNKPIYPPIHGAGFEGGSGQALLNYMPHKRKDSSHTAVAALNGRYRAALKAWKEAATRLAQVSVAFADAGEDAPSDEYSAALEKVHQTQQELDAVYMDPAWGDECDSDSSSSVEEGAGYSTESSNDTDNEGADEHEDGIPGATAEIPIDGGAMTRRHRRKRRRVAAQEAVAVGVPKEYIKRGPFRTRHYSSPPWVNYIYPTERSGTRDITFLRPGPVQRLPYPGAVYDPHHLSPTAELAALRRHAMPHRRRFEGYAGAGWSDVGNWFNNLRKQVSRPLRAGLDIASWVPGTVGVGATVAKNALDLANGAVDSFTGGARRPVAAGHKRGRARSVCSVSTTELGSDPDDYICIEPADHRNARLRKALGYAPKGTGPQSYAEFAAEFAGRSKQARRDIRRARRMRSSAFMPGSEST